MLKWPEKRFKFGFDFVYKHILDKQEHAEVNVYLLWNQFFWEKIHVKTINVWKALRYCATSGSDHSGVTSQIALGRYTLHSCGSVMFVY